MKLSVVKGGLAAARESESDLATLADRTAAELCSRVGIDGAVVFVLRADGAHVGCAIHKPAGLSREEFVVDAIDAIMSVRAVMAHAE